MPFYHVAYCGDRESIRERGLLCRHPDPSVRNGAEQMGNPPGVYVFDYVPDMRFFYGHHYDLWRVRTAGHTRHRDESLKGAWRLDCPIGPERLTLVHAGRGSLSVAA